MEAGSSESTNVEPLTSGSSPDPDVTLVEEEEVAEEEVEAVEVEEEEEEEEEEAEVALQARLPESLQHTPSPIRVNRRRTPKRLDSPDTPQQSSFHLLMLPETPLLPPPSRKTARKLLPSSSPKASTSAAKPSSRQPIQSHLSAGQTPTSGTPRALHSWLWTKFQYNLPTVACLL